MDILANPFRGIGFPPEAALASGEVSVDPSEVMELLAHCPIAAPTPLVSATTLARAFGIGALHIKDENDRMGLGSFKALGAASVIAGDAMRAHRAGKRECALEDALRDRVYVCASAGNHGLSTAAGARIFGARAVIHLADAVPEAFADRLRAMNAEVVRSGSDYATSMQAAENDARDQGWTLLSDSSWRGYVELPGRVMQGYLVMADEVVRDLEQPPTHVFLQAGVGGLAAALTAYFRDRWGQQPTIVVVEPTAAPALIESIRAGAPVKTAGPASNMGRLDCKEPSHLALGELARNADRFVTIDDDQADAAVRLLAQHGISTTPSGAAGVAALQHADEVREVLGLTASSRALAFVTEGREDVA